MLSARIVAHLNTLYTGFSMGKRIPFSEEEPFYVQIKSLADDELLDIWAETQELERMLREEWNAELELAPEYERLIVLELQLRSGQKASPVLMPPV